MRLFNRRIPLALVGLRFAAHPYLFNGYGCKSGFAAREKQTVTVIFEAVFCVNLDAYTSH